MKDEVIKFQEIETSLTLGGTGDTTLMSRVTVIHSYIHKSSLLRQTIPISVDIHT
jgi:hypothetical protein